MSTSKRTIQSNPLDKLTKVPEKTLKQSPEMTTPVEPRPKKPILALPALADEMANRSQLVKVVEGTSQQQARAAQSSQTTASTTAGASANYTTAVKGYSLSPLVSNANFAELRAFGGERLFVRYVQDHQIRRSPILWSKKSGEGVGFLDEKNCFISMAKLQGPLKIADVSERFGSLAVMALFSGGILGCAAVLLMMQNASQIFLIGTDPMSRKYVLLSRESIKTLVFAGSLFLKKRMTNIKNT